MTTTSAQPEDRWQTIKNIWKQNQWLYVIAGFLLGMLLFPFAQLVITDLAVLLGNLVPEAISTLVAVFVIDRIYHWHANKERLQELITQMRIENNAIAKAALEIIRLKGWLKDGSLQSTDLSNANLAGANLVRADLRDAYIHQANLQDANLREANLHGSLLLRTNLQRADLNANLRRAILVYADLRYARLFRANLQGADLRGANMEGATLQTISLKSTSRGTTQEILCAEFDELTILPDGTNWTPDTDMTRFTDSDHPQFWREYVYRGDS